MQYSLCNIFFLNMVIIFLISVNLVNKWTKTNACFVFMHSVHKTKT
jgi:hypothetical protein